MEQVIYGDILFIVNFSMDFLSLYITARIGHVHIRVATMILGACIGALYATVAIFADPGGPAGWLISLAVAWLMCYVTFNSRGILAALRQTLLFYGVGFLLGGVMTAFYNLLSKLSARVGARTAVINGDVNTLTSSIPLPVFIFLAVSAGLISVVFGRLYDRRKSAKTADLEIELGRRKIKASALCDSGNLAREPLGGLPVIFITCEKIRELLPSSVAEAVISGSMEEVSSLSQNTARRMRVILIQGAGTKSMAIGFTADRVLVNETEKNACICCTGENSYGGREALLPSVLL